MMDKLVAEGRLVWLLEQVAESTRPCRFCGRKLYFVKLRSNRVAPLTDEAVNHFADCPHFRKQPEPKQASLLDTGPDPL